jgi:hypothetical protein
MKGRRARRLPIWRLVGCASARPPSCAVAYFGRNLHTLQHTIASWCSGRECFLEITALLQGARLRISGSDETIREAIRMVRVWMRRTS